MRCAALRASTLASPVTKAAKVSEALGLPDHVFPVAALAVGYPAHAPRISPRLPLAATVHVDRFDDNRIADQIVAYDADRHARQSYRSQRSEYRFGTADPYTWSEDKARQYALSERADFGAFIRARGFRLD